ncbi:MAG TPA: head-tail connector protein [Methylocella sp.]|nr:head-tail connector protein [Methylocella sp.]
MASPFDLAGLVDVKAWLGISSTEDDALISQLITQISRVILAYLNRPSILPSSYEEVRDGRNDVSIMLRQWPVLEIETCTIDGVTITQSSPLTAGAPVTSGYVLDLPSSAPPGCPQRLSLRGLHFNQGLQNITVTYTAGYQISNEATTVPASLVVSAQAPYGSWAQDEGVYYSNGETLTAVTTDPSAGQYTVSSGGVYTFSDNDTGASLFLDYGYVPADLASCCTSWVAEQYSYRSRIAQQSKSLGGQETMAFIVKDIPDYVRSSLTPYRRVVMP